MKSATNEAIDILGERFPTLDWTYYDVPGTDGAEKTWHWLGGDDESVMMCVFRGTSVHERFHRQDFFFFNFAYKNAFTTISQRRDNRITVQPGEMVAGQPFTGYALDVEGDDDTVIVGVLIRKELFYEQFLPLFSNNRSLLHFFIDPESDRYSNDFIHLTARRGFPYRELLRVMLVEYANGGKGSQEILQAMTFTLTMYVARQFGIEHPEDKPSGILDQVEDYVARNLDAATLQGAAEACGYHPNYLSAVLRHESGQTFTQVRTRLRMERSQLLLEHTTLSVEAVATMLGYASTSNFYHAYRAYFGTSPRGGESKRGTIASMEDTSQTARKNHTRPEEALG